MTKMDKAHKIKVLVVDDHPLYRVGLKMALRYSNTNCEVVAEAESVWQAKECLKKKGHEIDLLMLDYFLIDGTAPEVLQAAEEHCPGMKILLLSGEVLPPTVMQAVEGRIDGFIGKTVKPEEMKKSIETLFDTPSEHETEANAEELTEREMEVIRLCAKGLSAKEIGEMLHIGKRTVETHKERIFLKLGLKSTSELINYAFRHGLTE